MAGRKNSITNLIKRAIPQEDWITAREVHEKLPEWAQEKYSVKQVSGRIRTLVVIEQRPKLNVQEYRRISN